MANCTPAVSSSEHCSESVVSTEPNVSQVCQVVNNVTESVAKRVKIDDINTAQLIMLRADTEKLAEEIQKIKEERMKFGEERSRVIISEKEKNLEKVKIELEKEK